MSSLCLSSTKCTLRRKDNLDDDKLLLPMLPCDFRSFCHRDRDPELLDLPNFDRLGDRDRVGERFFFSCLVSRSPRVSTCF